MNISKRVWIIIVSASAVLVVALLFLSFYVGAVSRLKAGSKALLSDRYDDAREKFGEASEGFFKKGTAFEGLALVGLFQGKGEEAMENFKEAADLGTDPSILDFREVADKLIGKGEVEKAALWAEHRGALFDDELLDYYSAVVKASRGEAVKALRDLEDLKGKVSLEFYPDLKAKVEVLEREIKRGLKRGERIFVYDRKSTPVLSRDMDSAEVVSKAFDIESLTGDPVAPGELLFGLEEKDLSNIVKLTIDADMQRAADRALGEYTGALVVLDPSTGEVLTAVSHPPEGSEAEIPVAFGKSYEPGSILKVLTLSAALRKKIPWEDVFPIHCEGNNFIVDGKIHYDWKPHGTIGNIHEALAVSCNMTFSKLGLLLGERTLFKELRRFLFDADPEGGSFPFRYGEILKEGLSNGELANAAIGLDSISITPVHAAIIAQILSNRGVYVKPSLVLEKKNLVGEPYYVREDSPEGVQILPFDQCLSIIKGMVLSVNDPEGTGRRISDVGASFALKTGTAGTRKNGLNAIIIGFEAVNEPRFAFALFAENAGKAELEGVRIIKSFFSSLKQRGLI